MKESLVLQDDQRGFIKKWLDADTQKPKSEQAIHKENIAQSVADAVAYMQQAPEKIQNNDEKPAQQEKPVPPTSPNVEQVQSKPDTPVDTAAIPTVSITENKVQQTFFTRMRNLFGKQPRSFSEDEQQKMQQEQKQIVEKETMRKRWQEFEEKKNYFVNKDFPHMIPVHMIFIRQRVLLHRNRVSLQLYRYCSFCFFW